MHFKMPQGYVVYSHTQNILKLSFGAIRGGKGKYFCDLCLSVFLWCGQIEKVSLATKLFYACVVNIGIFGPIEDSVNLTAIIGTLLQLFRSYVESSLEAKKSTYFHFCQNGSIHWNVSQDKLFNGEGRQCLILCHFDRYVTCVIQLLLF